MEPPLAPGEKPLFCTPEKITGGYPGVIEDDKQPNFDRELRELAEGWSAADELKFLWPDDPIKKESDVNEHQ